MSAWGSPALGEESVWESQGGLGEPEGARERLGEPGRTWDLGVGQAVENLFRGVKNSI